MSRVVYDKYDLASNWWDSDLIPGNKEMVELFASDYALGVSTIVSAINDHNLSEELIQYMIDKLDDCDGDVIVLYELCIQKKYMGCVDKILELKNYGVGRIHELLTVINRQSEQLKDLEMYKSFYDHYFGYTQI